jgi:hypothetical protein
MADLSSHEVYVRERTEMHRPMRVIVAAIALGALTACAHSRAPELAVRASAPDSAAEAAAFAAAVDARVADLKARGGECEEYGSLLESALASGHITLRPFMWRVDGNLASAQGESNGEMTIARDIDSLNVGVRKLEDVLRSAEHEAAHIALRIPSGGAMWEARVDASVRSCHSAVK